MSETLCDHTLAWLESLGAAAERVKALQEYAHGAEWDFAVEDAIKLILEPLNKE